MPRSSRKPRWDCDQHVAPSNFFRESVMGKPFGSRHTISTSMVVSIVLCDLAHCWVCMRASNGSLGTMLLANFLQSSFSTWAQRIAKRGDMNCSDFFKRSHNAQPLSKDQRSKLSFWTLKRKFKRVPKKKCSLISCFPMENAWKSILCPQISLTTFLKRYHSWWNVLISFRFVGCSISLPISHTTSVFSFWRSRTEQSFENSKSLSHHSSRWAGPTQLLKAPSAFKLVVY